MRPAVMEVSDQHHAPAHWFGTWLGPRTATRNFVQQWGMIEGINAMLSSTALMLLPDALLQFLASSAGVYCSTPSPVHSNIQLLLLGLLVCYYYHYAWEPG
jgi:hypothetical protein